MRPSKNGWEHIVYNGYTYKMNKKRQKHDMLLLICRNNDNDFELRKYYKTANRFTFVPTANKKKQKEKKTLEKMGSR